MKKLHFSVNIKAPAKVVWDILWTDDTYRQWTSVFSEGSYAVSDWKEGSRISFLSPEGGGMYSRISKKVPNELMVFTHEGVIKNGVEEPLDEETRKWSGSEESYLLKETNGSTELVVELDVTEEHFKYFDDVFPKALDKVKKLAEGEGSASS